MNHRLLLPAFRHWVGLSALLVTGRIAAGDQFQVQTNYYPVSGRSIREVRQALNTVRPWKEPPMTDALTRWEVRWNYSLRATAQGCTVHELTIKTTVTITLPRWKSDTGLPDAVKDRWEKYLQALRHHEDGHKRIALAAAAEIRKRIRALKPDPDCATLNRNIETAASAVLTEYRQKDADYDTRTEHGVQQGARFP